MSHLTEEKVEDLIEEPMGDDDIRYYFPSAKIFKYSQLAEYRRLEDLLGVQGQPVDYCFLLYEDSPNKGHWTLLSRYGNTVEFFCSYGSKVDEPLGWIPCSLRKPLHQCKPYMSNLLNQSPFEVVYNPVAYQGEGGDVNSCGRHCVLRLSTLLHDDYRLPQYYDFLRELHRKSGATYDEIVATLIHKQ